jgi:hypothetical protein
MSASDLSEKLGTGPAQPTAQAPSIADHDGRRAEDQPRGALRVHHPGRDLPDADPRRVGRRPVRPPAIGGYIGITCGVAAWYVAFAHVTNATFGRDLIPTWPLR